MTDDIVELIEAVALLIGALFALMVIEAIEVAIAGWAFLGLDFWDGWHAAWGKPVLLALFAAVSGLTYSWRKRD